MRVQQEDFVTIIKNFGFGSEGPKTYDVDVENGKWLVSENDGEAIYQLTQKENRGLQVDKFFHVEFD